MSCGSETSGKAQAGAARRLYVSMKRIRTSSGGMGWSLEARSRSAAVMAMIMFRFSSALAFSLVNGYLRHSLILLAIPAAVKPYFSNNTSLLP